MFRLQIKYSIYLFLSVLFLSFLGGNIFSVQSAFQSQDTSSYSVSIGLGIGDFLDSYFQKRSDNGAIKDMYKQTFSTDIFAQALSSAQEQRVFPSSAGVKYVQKQLQEVSCSFSLSDISTILYHKNVEFRILMMTEMAREKSLAKSIFPSLTADQMSQACVRFYMCYNGLSESQARAQNPLNCSSFIDKMYQEGRSDSTWKQMLSTAAYGQDRFWNGTLEDSSYDLLYDISMIGNLLFQGAKDKKVPSFMFYQFPLAGSKSGSSSQESGGFPSQENNGTSPNSGDTLGSGSSKPTGTGSNTGSSGQGGSSSQEKNDSSSQNAEDKTSQDKDVKDFLDLYGSSSLIQNSLTSLSQVIGGNVCLSGSFEDESWDDLLDDVDMEEQYPPEDYEKFVNDLLDEINSFDPKDPLDNGDKSLYSGSLPPHSDFTPPADDLGDTSLVDQVKSCVNSCEGSYDQKAVCMVMCTCNKWESKIFDPMKTPGLGPIMRIKFCAVPAAAASFSSQGKVVYSVEEVFQELKGIMQSLDRSGELVISKRQEEFLDTSIKDLNFGKNFSFTISSLFGASKSKEHGNVQKAQKEELNNSLLLSSGIPTTLSDPSQINSYVQVGDVSAGKESQNFASSSAPQLVSDKISSLMLPITYSESMYHILRTEKYILMNEQMLGYIHANISFWLGFYQDMTTFKDTIKILEQKKLKGK